MDPATIALWVAAAVLMAMGVVGLVVPALPGAPLLFLGALLAAWAEDFRYLGMASLVVLGALAVIAVVVDFVAGAFGVRRYGASRRAVIGATVGAFVGLFFGLVGVLLGPFVGAVLGELSTRRNLAAASRAGFGAALGMALGTAAKLAIACAMLGVVIAMRLFA